MTTGELHPPVGKSDHIQGSANASITLLEYGDFECSSCGVAYPIVKSIQQQLGDKLRFVFRQFPLSEAHPHAQHAAEVAEAAAAQGSFWEMHDLLYENQEQLSDRDLVRYAGETGIDTSAAERLLEDGTYTDTVRQQFMTGVRSGVNGTPTFFLNGIRYDGEWNDETEFLRALNDAARSGG